MMNISGMYFSPTGTTKTIVETISATIANEKSGGAYVSFDFTPKEVRNGGRVFRKDDLVVIGTPVIAGRVPNVLLKYLQTIEGNGAKAVCIVLYGNRNYDDALIELRNIAKEQGFSVIAAGAFIGEHSFSKILAKGRPDADDLKTAVRFADQICDKLDQNGEEEQLMVKGYEPYRPYYMPKDREGNPVDIRKVTPKTNESCNQCGICVAACPMGSIDAENPAVLNGICIKCGACIKKCPQNAKYYDDGNYLRHQYELEEQFQMRNEPELFV